MKALVTGKDTLFLKAVDFLILSRRNEETAVYRKLGEKISCIKFILLGFLVSFALAFLQEIKKSWPRTKVEIEVEENESLAFQFMNHPKYPQPS